MLSNKLSICTSFGGMQMNYKYLFDSYRDLLTRYHRGEIKDGIRYLMNIENKERKHKLNQDIPQFRDTNKAHQG